MFLHFLRDFTPSKVLMQGKLFQKCAHFLYCRKSKHKTAVTAWHGIHFHKNNLWTILVFYEVNYQNDQNEMPCSSLDTRRTLMHLFLFTNSAQRELVSICTQLTFLALVPWHHPWRTKSYSDTKTNRILPITLSKVKQCISRFILKISMTGLRNSNKGRKGQTMDWQHLIVMSVTLHC